MRMLYVLASVLASLSFAGDRLDPVKEAARLGFKKPVGPFQTSEYSPFIRMIRENGEALMDSRGCAKIDFSTNVGKLPTTRLTRRTHRPFFANPYVYVSFEMKLASGDEEYIEAGMGFATDAEGRTFYAPYVRRAPDEFKFDDSQPPEGWRMMRGIRGGVLQDLPGYWVAKQDRLAQLMAIDGEFCYQFRFDEKRDMYVFDYLIRNPREGVMGAPVKVEMPSVRKTLAGSIKSKVVGFHTRILTSIAITDNEFDPKDPAFDGIGVGVRWKSEIRDRSQDNPVWEPFDHRQFKSLNYDPKGESIYYELLAPKPGEIPEFGN